MQQPITVRPDRLKDAFERLYRWAKQDPLYALPDDISSGLLLEDAAKRVRMLLRGLLVRWRFGRVSGPFFLGRGVQIRGARHVTLGRSAAIHDQVRFDGRARRGVQIGDNFTLREFGIIECTGVVRYPGESLVIGDNVGISQYCFIGVRGPISIGNDVQIGPRVTIYAENHGFAEKTRLIREQGVQRQGIVIEDDCWLGSGVTVLDGVTIGRGSVIAAGSVVTKNVPPYSIVAGVPGKVLRQRGGHDEDTGRLSDERHP